MNKRYAGMRILPFSLLLFVHLVPSSFAADLISRDSIREIQTILLLKGHYDGSIDGLNGTKTERAILLYERNNGQPLTGQPSLELLETLREQVHSALNRDGSTEADTQLNELRSKVDVLEKTLTDTERERASLSNAVVRMGKDYQTDKSLRERDLDSITIGSTLLKDLTTITLSLIALALTAGFVATYIGLRATLRSRLLKDHETMLNLTEAKIFYLVYVNLSHGFYLYYREFLDKPQELPFQVGVSLALWFANGAISNAEKLKKLAKKDPNNQELLMRAEAHRAYHYASEGLQSSPNVQSALEVASQLNELAKKSLKKDKNKDTWAAFRDTRAWILIRLGDRQQQAEGRRIVTALLNDDDIPPAVRQRFRQNYAKIGEIMRL